MLKKELEIHESLFNNIINGNKTQTIRLGEVKMTNKFRFISSYTKRTVDVNLIDTKTQKYNTSMNLTQYYEFITEKDTVTIINFTI